MLHNGNVDICMIIIMANSGRDQENGVLIRELTCIADSNAL